MWRFEDIGVEVGCSFQPYASFFGVKIQSHVMETDTGHEYNDWRTSTKQEELCRAEIVPAMSKRKEAGLHGFCVDEVKSKLFAGVFYTLLSAYL